MKVYTGEKYNADMMLTQGHLQRLIGTMPYIIPELIQLYPGLTFNNLVEAMGYDGVKSGAVTEIGSNRFEWRVQGLPFKKIQIVSYSGSTVTPALNPGANGSEFQIYLNDSYFKQYEIIRFEDGTQAVIIADPIVISKTIIKYRCVIDGNKKDSVLAGKFITAGRTVSYGGNKNPELSLTGHNKRAFYDKYINWLTIQRTSIAMSGDAITSDLWMPFERNGDKMYLPREWSNAMQKVMLDKELNNWFGEATMTADGKCTMVDVNGNEIISGDGILRQVDPAHDFYYDTLNLDFINPLLLQMSYYTNTIEDNGWVLHGGRLLLSAWTQMLERYFIQKSTFFYTPSGKPIELDANHYKTYNFAGQHITFAVSDIFDNKFLASEVDPRSGFDKISGFGVLLNHGSIKGIKNVQCFAKKGRSLITTYVDGMHTLDTGGFNKHSSSGIDAGLAHFLTHTGCAYLNPMAAVKLHKL